MTCDIWGGTSAWGTRQHSCTPMEKHTFPTWHTRFEARETQSNPLFLIQQKQRLILCFLFLTMHARSYSEATSVDQFSPARRFYYVQSPSSNEVEKMSYVSSPMGSPPHHFYHSRESSSSRFSAAFKNNINRNGNPSAWRKLHRPQDPNEEEEESGDRNPKWNRNLRLYLSLFLLLFLLFTVFFLILWGATKSFRPQILIQVKPIFYYLRSVSFWLGITIFNNDMILSILSISSIDFGVCFYKAS